MKKIRCKVCKKWFEPTEKGQKLCCRECAIINARETSKRWRLKQQSTIETRTCIVCGDAFECNARSDRSTCCRSCTYKWKQKMGDAPPSQREHRDKKKERASHKYTFDDTVKECAQTGKTYAQRQMEKTLSSIPKIDVTIYQRSD